MIEAPPLRIAFTVYGVAAPAGSKRHVGNGRIVDSSKRAAPWKNLVAEYAAQAMAIACAPALGDPVDGVVPISAIPLLDGPLAVKMVFYVVRPKAHYSARTSANALRDPLVPHPTAATPGTRGLLQSAPVWPTTRPDVLKLARAVEDACTGIIWRDDAQIVDETLVKKYGEPARVEVTVMEA